MDFAFLYYTDQSKIFRIMVRQRNRRIHFQSGFFGSLDAPWSEISWIDLSSKEMQNPFSDSYGFKNPILVFLKKRTLRLTEFEGCTVTYGPSSFPDDLWLKHKPCRPYSMDQEHKVSKIFIISLLCIWWVWEQFLFTWYSLIDWLIDWMIYWWLKISDPPRKQNVPIWNH